MTPLNHISQHPFFQERQDKARLGEFIKRDSQGAEYEILGGAEDRRCLNDLTGELSSNEDRRASKGDTARLMAACRQHPDHTCLQAKKFIDRHRSNSNVVFIDADKEIYHSAGGSRSI